MIRKFSVLMMAILLIVFITGCSNGEEENDFIPVLEEEEEADALVVDREDPFLIFVNKENTLSSDYVPENLVPIDGRLSSNQGISADETALNAYLSMREAALKEDVNMVICSAYRSYHTQEIIYNNYLNSRGEEWTNLHSAYPGTSEHQTGLAMDITSAEMGYGLDRSFADTKEGVWLAAHCAEYGFIIRYMEGKEEITGYTYEPWHIRYVGVEYAKIIMDEGISLEEFFGEISEE